MSWLCKLIGHDFEHDPPVLYCRRCGEAKHNPTSAPPPKLTEDHINPRYDSDESGETMDVHSHADRHGPGGPDEVRQIDRLNRSMSGVCTAGDFTVLLTGRAADGETVEVDQATFVMSDGTAVPSGCDAIIATLDNAGGGTSRSTILSGDGSTIYDDETGNPLDSWTNDTGAAITVAIGVDNGHWNAGSGADQDVQLSIVGVIR